MPSAQRFRFEKTRWVHFSTTWAGVSPRWTCGDTSYGGAFSAVNGHFSISETVSDFRERRDEPPGDLSAAVQRIDFPAVSPSFGGSAGAGSWESAFFGNGRAKPGFVACALEAHLAASRISGGFGAGNIGPEE